MNKILARAISKHTWAAWCRVRLDPLTIRREALPYSKLKAKRIQLILYQGNLEYIGKSSTRTYARGGDKGSNEVHGSSTRKQEHTKLRNPLVHEEKLYYEFICLI